MREGTGGREEYESRHQMSRKNHYGTLRGGLSGIAIKGGTGLEKKCYLAKDGKYRMLTYTSLASRMCSMAGQTLRCKSHGAGARSRCQKVLDAGETGKGSKKRQATILARKKTELARERRKLTGSSTLNTAFTQLTRRGRGKRKLRSKRK